MAAGAGSLESTWSTGKRRDLRPGDRFFLLRQGRAPRGLMGAGLVLSAPVEAPHWDEARRNAGDTTLTCEVEFDALLPREAVLSIAELERAGLDAVNWSPQTGGTQVPPQLVADLEQVWRDHLRGHLMIARPEIYTLETLLEDGCFLERSRLERILQRLESKKNLILQGPPGTGKTWLAKRLGQVLVGHRGRDRVRVVQFHPNVSYEDFVRGYRPDSEGKLRVTDGFFLEAVAAARAQPDEPMVVVIEEINRGNPAQVFGELLTLLEASRRSREYAMDLAYPDPEPGTDRGARRTPLFLPANLYLIGTMNTADRSIAMVDLAFRRRFAFETLTPLLGPSWVRWLADHGVSERHAARIQTAVTVLNRRIEEHRTLGRDYCIGHSYFTPHQRLNGDDEAVRLWFTTVVESEIAPLLEEYWFDDRSAAESALRSLQDALEG
jgi:5-methylcytosine-specific restriction protein B